MRISKLGTRQRQQAASHYDFFGYENVFCQVPAKSVTYRYFVDATPAIPVALQVINGGMIHRRLYYVTLAGMKGLLQLRPHLNQGNNAFVAKDQRPTTQIPSVHELMIRSLVNQLDKRSADSGRIDSAQHLARPGVWCGDLADMQVLEPGSIEN